jgi:uncharacterized membrane protein
MTLHGALMAIHIVAGLIALPAGTLAVVARKGGAMHLKAGMCFFAAMLVLGVTAAILEPLREPPGSGSPIGGLIVCYFVATSWTAARRRDGTTGRFEIAACAAIFILFVLMIWGGLTGSTTPAGPGPVFAIAGVCLIAGLLDLNAILRCKLTSAQRIARHLWRMCFAFFIATGSFFLGQQDALPEAVRGSPALFVLAFAPFGVMAFWLVRVRFSTMIGRLKLKPRPVAASPGHG